MANIDEDKLNDNQQILEQFGMILKHKFTDKLELYYEEYPVRLIGWKLGGYNFNIGLKDDVELYLIMPEIENQIREFIIKKGIEVIENE